MLAACEGVGSEADGAAAGPGSRISMRGLRGAREPEVTKSAPIDPKLSSPPGGWRGGSAADIDIVHRVDQVGIAVAGAIGGPAPVPLAI